MAPEQAQGEKVDARADLFSLGVLLYRLATGTLPFPGDSLLAVIGSLATREPEPMQRLRPDTPPALAELVQRLLAKSKEERPASASAVAAELAAIEAQFQGPPTLSAPGLPAAAVQPLAAIPAPEAVEKPSVNVQKVAQRRRPRRWAAVAATLLGIATAVVLGVVIIRITGKDGKQIEISVPDGSKVTVNDKGEVDVKLPGVGEKAAASPLDKLAPAQIPAAERFDWQPKELVAVLGGSRGLHWGRVNAASFDPDGKRVACAAGHLVYLWDIQQRRQLAVLHGHTGEVYDVHFSPDGTALLSASPVDGTVRVWDIATGKQRAVTSAEGTSTTPWRISLAPDGKTMAWGDDAGNAKVWDIKEDREVTTFPGDGQRCWSVAVSPDGTLLAVGRQDGTVRLRNIGTRNEVAKLPGHKGWPWERGFSRDGKLLAVVSGAWGQPGEVKLWDVASGKAIRSLEPGEGDPRQYAGCAFSLDGSTLAVGGRGGVCRWDVKTGRPLEPLTGHLGQVFDVRYSPDGKTLLTAGEDHTARLWDAATGKEQAVLGEHRYAPAIAFAADARALGVAISRSYDGEFTFWATDTGKRIRTIAHPSGQPNGLAYSPDGKTLALGGYDGLAVWDLDANKEKSHFEPPGPVYSVAFSPNGKLLASASFGGTAKLWDIEGKKELASFPSPGAVAFSADGRLLVAGGKDNAIVIWDVNEQRQRAELKGHTDLVRAVVFAPGGQLVSGSQDTSVRVWDLTTGKEVKQFSGHDGRVEGVFSVTLSPAGDRLASAGRDGRLILRKFPSGEEVQRWQFPGIIHRVAFAPDGRHLVTANDDSTAYILRLATPDGKPR
jgi:WD40 repeat protein